ncbi:hypothetical protein NAEGRDRAFT_80979 [Naegleria gruberi]|uniref:PI-PLC Y-box domain-containing protein n=1 Tax=Naegleria gruberi TaxID=5762 RepID=D2VRJ0_NAEGR|nr:uncharacterized protein NAEGRDRAFT_80979 [Naegleria gruberi]EFC40610.1 hypothetical protein NAEGRDRAFT_80979 [Naegleria gruberi]|eukprot:XP_002673354.1 hypothetical protein NAEGRDRAFT_80979 [Naegleria gruberi strain NEG-M]
MYSNDPFDDGERVNRFSSFEQSEPAFDERMMEDRQQSFGGPSSNSALDPALRALIKYRRRKFTESVDACNQLLSKNYKDMSMWYIKCRALTAKMWIDDTEMEDEGIADILLDETSVTTAPRPGTSLKRPHTNSSGKRSANPSVRPQTKDGRPITGFSRPGTNSGRNTASRGGTGTQSRGGTSSIENIFKGARPGTTRPVTTTGRFVRLGTASMKISGLDQEYAISTEHIDLKKYAAIPPLAKALYDYFIVVEHDVKKALELASYATIEAEFKDWWWKARLGKCYYQLGLLREAEKQYRSAIKSQHMIATCLELGKVFLRLDQPNKALEEYESACLKFPNDTHLILGIARVYDSMNDLDKAIQYYEKVLHLNSSNVESIACLAGNYFYEDQPEVAIRLYRRLIQMGVNNSELWNNLGLCCFYASQYDMVFSCFDRALQLAEDNNEAEVWYNIGQVAIGIGDVGLAYQCFKIATSIDNEHAESFNNLGVLELRMGNTEESKNYFAQSMALGPSQHEQIFNNALLSFKRGNHQQAHELVLKILKDIYPEHADSQELRKKLEAKYLML